MWNPFMFKGYITFLLYFAGTAGTDRAARVQGRLLKGEVATEGHRSEGAGAENQHMD